MIRSLLGASVGAALLVLSAGAAADRPIATATLRRIATVDERYQSYNVEMAEVIGGHFWKPYDAETSSATTSPSQPLGGSAPQAAGVDPSLFQARPPIDLTNARLRTLAAALGPAYMRTSGTWANMVYFLDADTPPPTAAPTGFQGILTRSEWKGVVEFTHAVNARLVSSFAISEGVRNSSGAWTPDQAQRFANYTKNAGGEIAAAEFFNEPNMPTYGSAPAGYTAADYARDFARFRQFVNATVPQMHVVGPGSVGEGTLMDAMHGKSLAAELMPTEAILAAAPKPVFDIFSYHHYGAVSKRCAAMGADAQTTADAALSEEWLTRTDKSYQFYSALRDRFEPGKPIWLTESAEAACGGNPWAAEFLDTFRYLDQLGRLAKRGVNVVFHNTLASSEYGLLDQETFLPRPNYWAAVLWHRLMGSTVFDPGPTQPQFHIYAHCLPRHAGGVTLLAINISRTEEHTLELLKRAERYTFSAPRLDATEVTLNGVDLKLQANDALPDFHGVRTAAGRVRVAPVTIEFLAVPDADNPACR